MQRTTSGAAGNGLYTTIKYRRGASGIGMGTTIKHLRRTTSGAAESSLGATMKYLRRTTNTAANNGLSTMIIFFWLFSMGRVITLFDLSFIKPRIFLCFACWIF
jgi:hypothetical protein